MKFSTKFHNQQLKLTDHRVFIYVNKYIVCHIMLYHECTSKTLRKYIFNEN